MVTSPPYPMIEMWDEIFSLQNPIIKMRLQQKMETPPLSLMHQELDKVWTEVHRVLKEGGFACVNIGDATRKIGNELQTLSKSLKDTSSTVLSLGFSCSS